MLFRSEQIKQLKARYFRLMDTKDWVAWKDLFTDDCLHYLPREVNRPPQTNAQYLEYVPGHLADAFTTHHGHMPEIEILSPTTAQGVWAMEDRLRWESGPVRSLHGYGHYHDTYERGDEGWRIASTSLTRVRVDVEMNQMVWSSVIDRS